MSVPRPWRAIAYRIPETHEIEGRTRPVAGRTAAKTAEGLRRFVDDHEARGNVVDVFEVLDLLDELDEEDGSRGST